jgi:hypothetical protein
MKELSTTLKAFCEQADLLRLTFLDVRGYPRVVPVWFVIIDGAHFIGTGATSAKWKAMQRHSKVGWVIDGGTRGHYKGASLPVVRKRSAMHASARESSGRWGGSTSAPPIIRSSSKSSAGSMMPKRSMCASCPRMCRPGSLRVSAARLRVSAALG